MTTQVKIETNKFIDISEAFKDYKGYCIIKYDNYNDPKFVLFNSFKELLDFIDDGPKLVDDANHVIESPSEKCKVNYNNRTLIVEYDDNSDHYTKYVYTNISKNEYNIIVSMVEKKLPSGISYSGLIE